MSRHRAIRNLNLDDELADDDEDYEENPYDDISEEDRSQLEQALSQLVSVIGQPGAQSGFTEREMKDILWDAYFDVDQSVTTLVEERSKREQKEKRKQAGELIEDEPPLNAMRSLNLRSSNDRRGRRKGEILNRGEKRLADDMNVPQNPISSTLRPNKLAAISIEESSSSKPMSKLQQKMQATMLAKQQKRQGIPSKEEQIEAIAAKERQKQIELLPSGERIEALFSSGISNAANFSLMTPIHNELQSIPGGNPLIDYYSTASNAFSKPSPDDIILNARQESAQRKQAKSSTGSKPGSGASTPSRGGPSKQSNQKISISAAEEPVNQLRQNIEGLGLSKVKGNNSSTTSDGTTSAKGSSIPGTPKIGITHERIIEEWKQLQTIDGAKKRINLVVIGHVDAGKSTLMGKLLHTFGSLSDREHNSNERASSKLGKSSFAYAWALDSSQEERERGITIDVGQDYFMTKNRIFTLLDAPGHRDFIPNMISGASQADVALLVIDASKGAFESGFGQQGQTREHALLVRSLGVQRLIVVINKMDAINYDEERFKEIELKLKPFLSSIGFEISKISFIPCGAFTGENVETLQKDGILSCWYSGPSLVKLLDELEPPQKSIENFFRMPITNVFKSNQISISSGIGISGRIISGVLSIGDKLTVVPTGEEIGIVKGIEFNNESVLWAIAGWSITVYLINIEINFIKIGSILCPLNLPVSTTNSFIAQLLIFEPTLPILSGTILDLYHHSSNISATISELIAILDIKTGSIIKSKPRILSKGVTAKVLISLNSILAIETFANSRDLGRILLRMNGETVAAGIVLELL